jgi:hypothetical protein
MTTVQAPQPGRPDRRLPILALAIAAALLVASVVMAVLGVFGPAPWRSPVTGGVTGPGSNGLGGMGGQWPQDGRDGGYGRMMTGQLWLAGNGQQVTGIAQARARASEAGAAEGLRAGEIIRFTDNFYVELKDASGASATEVLVDPASGAVQTEPGPAMMWNTGSRTGTITETRARMAATAWLTANRPGETTKTIDAYPGYYTVDTEANGTIAGMLSVNATTGAVWYHTWHGRFVAMEDG